MAVTINPPVPKPRTNVVMVTAVSDEVDTARATAELDSTELKHRAVDASRRLQLGMINPGIEREGAVIPVDAEGAEIKYADRATRAVVGHSRTFQIRGTEG